MITSEAGGLALGRAPQQRRCVFTHTQVTGLTTKFYSQVSWERGGNSPVVFCTERVGLEGGRKEEEEEEKQKWVEYIGDTDRLRSFCLCWTLKFVSRQDPGLY